MAILKTELLARRGFAPRSLLRYRLVLETGLADWLKGARQHKFNETMRQDIQIQQP